MTPRIESLFFDLGNVIVFFDHGISCRRLASLAGKTVEEIYDFVFRSGLEARLDRGEITPGEFREHATRFLGVPYPEKEFRKLWEEIFSPNDEIFPLLESLKKRYSLFLLSNTNVLHYTYCRKTYPILDIFDDFILSFEVGSRKPEDRIFLAGLERARIEASRAVYIDDLNPYVVRARELGFHSIHYRSVPQLKDDLRKIAILF